MRAFQLLRNDTVHPNLAVGMTLYPYAGPDFGLLEDAKQITGIEGVAVTLDKAGGTPFYVVARPALNEIEVADLPPLTMEAVDTVCKIGKGAACCRYLVAGSEGFECAKFEQSVRLVLDNRAAAGTITARGDNCEGRTGTATGKGDVEE